MQDKFRDFAARHKGKLTRSKMYVTIKFAPSAVMFVTPGILRKTSAKKFIVSPRRISRYQKNRLLTYSTDTVAGKNVRKSCAVDSDNVACWRCRRFRA